AAAVHRDQLDAGTARQDRGAGRAGAGRGRDGGLRPAARPGRRGGAEARGAGSEEVDGGGGGERIGEKGMRAGLAALVAAIGLGGVACRQAPAPSPMTAAGYVEATEVRIASKVAGRAASVGVAEGQRVTAGQVLVTLDTTDVDVALERARAERG